MAIGAYTLARLTEARQPAEAVGCLSIGSIADTRATREGRPSHTCSAAYGSPLPKTKLVASLFTVLRDRSLETRGSSGPESPPAVCFSWQAAW